MMQNTFKKTIHLELTTKCRLECPKCDRTIALDKGTLVNTDMPFELVEKYASNDEYSKFTLCGSFGDPIYYPRFLDIIKTFKDNNKTVDIFTNSSGKKLDWWHELFSMLDPNDKIWFGIDGLEDTCGMYRVNFTEKDFHFAMQLMKIARHEYGLNPIWIFIAFRFNEHQVEEAKMRAKEIGIDFCLRKSSRWDKNDNLMPTNKNLISIKSIV